MNSFLMPTFYLDWETPFLRERATSLVQGVTPPTERAVRLFYFVRDGIRYTTYGKRSLPGHYRASQVLRSGEGYCVQKAVLLTAMARAVGISARLCFAAIRNHQMPPDLLARRGTNLLAYHGYVEIFLGETWIKAAPTFDKACCQKAGLRPVEFDGQSQAVLPSTTLDGQPHIEYVQDRGWFEDVPFEDIMKASLSRTYLQQNPSESNGP